MKTIYICNSVILREGQDISKWLWSNVRDNEWQWGIHDAFGQFMNLSLDEDAILFRLRFGV